MRFWFVHSGEVSIREQIATQVMLGILSEELAAGERLPSTRELARRFGLHANTVSGAYRQLESEGWVESRHGSGVFVRRDRSSVQRTHAGSSVEGALEHLFARFLNSARRLSVPEAEIRACLRQWLHVPQTAHFLLIEPSEPLCRIVEEELSKVLKLPLSLCSPADADVVDRALGSVVLTLPSKAATVRSMLPPGTELIALQIRSASSSLAEWLPASTEALVGIASCWPPFLEIAHTMLVAAGFSADALVVRDTGKDGWADGLGQTSAVVCDVYTVKQLPAGIRAIPFPLLTEASLNDLRKRQSSMAPLTNEPGMHGDLLPEAAENRLRAGKTLASERPPRR